MSENKWTQEMINRITPDMACRCCGTLLLIPVLIHRLMQLEEYLHVRLTTTNAYRCETHNAEVGGHPQSRHLDGLAIDVVDPIMDNFHSIAKRYFGGVLLYPNKNIWHLQVPPPRP